MIFIFSLAFLCFSYVASTSRKVVAPYYREVSIYSKSPELFTIDLSYISSDAHVSISVVSNHYKTPALYVSWDENSLTPRDCDYSSTNESGNIIFISKEKLGKSKILYVKLECKSRKCQGDVAFEFIHELFVQPDQPLAWKSKYDFLETGSAVAKLNIPNLDNVNRIVVRIYTSMEQYVALKHEPYAFLNKGNDVPSMRDAADILEAAWLEQKYMIISADSSLFCTECNYTLSVKVARKLDVGVDIRIRGVETDLGNYQLFDGTRKNQFNMYKVEVASTKANQDLVISVQPYKGKLTVYIDCDTRPKDYEDYRLEYQVEEFESIVLTGMQRNKCQTSIYYIGVRGRTDSVYSIKVVSRFADNIYLEADQHFKSKISFNETINYGFFVKNSQFAKFKQIEFSLESAHLPNINMSIVPCKVIEDCKDLFLENPELNNSTSIDHTAAQSEIHSIDFNYDLQKSKNQARAIVDFDEEGSCYPIYLEDLYISQPYADVCAYKITLRSNNPSLIEYSLKAHPVRIHNFIFGGWPTKLTLFENEVKNISYLVTEPNAKEVMIQLTKFSGDFEVYASQKEGFSFEEAQKMSQQGIILFKNASNLNTTYYITIIGAVTSSLQLSTSVLADEEEIIMNARILNQGAPQEDVLNVQKGPNALFYKFDVDIDDEWKGHINVSIESKAQIFVSANSKNQIPSPSYLTWYSSQNKMPIYSTHNDFTNKGTYIIGVYPDLSKPYLSFDDIHFSITWSLHEKHVEDYEPQEEETLSHHFLSPTTLFRSTLKRYKNEFYESFILPTDQKIVISAQTETGIANLYVSFDLQNKYPNENNYTYSIRLTHLDYIILEQSQWKEACNKQDSKICTFYISVIPEDDQGFVCYILSLEKNSQQSSKLAILLKNGEEKEFPLSTLDSSPEIFYLEIPPYESGVLSVFCPGVPVAVRAIISRNKIEHPTDFKLIRPSQIQKTISINSESKDSEIVELVIPQSTRESSAIISLQFGVSDQENSEVLAGNYSIVFESSIVPILPGRQYQRYVKENQYKYYSFFLPCVFCNVSISVTELSGGNIHIVLGQNDGKGLPTLSSSDFAVKQFQSSKILSLLVDQNSPTMGFIVGVYGYKLSKYRLFIFSGRRINEVKQWQRISNILTPGYLVYFFYNHTTQNDVQLEISQGEGAYMYITTIPYDGDIIQSLPSKNSHKWTINPGSESFLVSANDSKGCSKCIYLITLEPYLMGQYVFMVNVGDPGHLLVPGGYKADHLTPGSSKAFYAFPNVNDEVLLIVNLPESRIHIHAGYDITVNSGNRIWGVELNGNNEPQIVSLQKLRFRKDEILDPSIFQTADENLLFLKFENPTPSPVDYSSRYNIQPESMFGKLQNRFYNGIDVDVSNLILFYLETEAELFILHFEIKIPQLLIKEIEGNRAIKIKPYFFEDSEQVLATNGLILEDYALIEGSEVQSRGTEYIIRQTYITRAKVGKFCFLITNISPKSFSYSLFAEVTQPNTKFLDRNSQLNVTLKTEQVYQTVISPNGIWYLWILSCNGNIAVSIQDESDFLEEAETEIIQVLAGEQYFSKVLRVYPDKMEYIKLIKNSSDQEEVNVILRSSFFFFKESHDYDAKTSSIQTEVYSEFNNNKASVKFGSLIVNDYDSSDKIVYQIKICTYTANFNIYHNVEKCTVKTLKKDLTREAEQIEMNFEGLEGGKHFVYVVADIEHESRSVKSAYYQPETIEFENSSQVVITDDDEGQDENKAGIGLFGLICLVVIGALVLMFAGFMVYRCIRRFTSKDQELYSGGISGRLLMSSS